MKRLWILAVASALLLPATAQTSSDSLAEAAKKWEELKPKLEMAAQKAALLDGVMTDDDPYGCVKREWPDTPKCREEALIRMQAALHVYKRHGWKDGAKY